MSENEFDVVVVGCGVAGLNAAVAARQQGARVALLERATREERGGSTRYTEAFLRMKNHDEVADDFEEHFMLNAGGNLDPAIVAETMRGWDERSTLSRSMGFADPELIAEFARNAGPTIRWMESFGVQFDFFPTPFLTSCTPRMSPRGGGLAIVEGMAAAAEKLGVEFFYRTTARSLILDDAGGVAGLSANGEGGAGLRFTARSVVLGCGGFAGNPEMMTQYVGPRSLFLRPVARGGHYNKGEGIRMALAAGAATSGDFGSFHAEPIDPRSGIAEPAIFIFPYGILVNSEGRRFIDEAPGTVDATYEPITRRIHAQDGGIAWVILDARLDDIPNKQVAIRTDQPPLTGATIAELAGVIGVPAERLEATVAAYNAACPPEAGFKALEIDGLATRGLDPQKSNWARPIDRGPFLAYPIMSANVFTFGGVKIDGSGNVLNADGDPIAGLYAAGEMVGVYYGTYTGSTSVLKGAVFGRLSGLAAAARATVAA